MRAAALALVLGSLTACGGPTGQVASIRSNCAASPLIGIAEGFRGPYRWSGATIAGPADVSHTAGSKGQLWILAVERPPRTMILTAARTDAATRTAFEVWRYPAADGLTPHAPVRLPDGAFGYFYAATALSAVLYESGCWRVEASDGNAVTIPVR